MPDFRYLIVCFCFGWVLQGSAQTGGIIRAEQDSILINKSSSQSKAVVKVYRGMLVKANLSKTRPIIGTLNDHSSSYLTFIPLVPFSFGQNYTLTLGDQVEYFHIEPPADYKRLRVHSVAPSAPQIPSNVLKWYLQFNRPVSSINVYAHIRFLDQAGEVVPRAILPLENALLNADRTMLTIWIEPGRQKRALGPNQRLGTVFEEGQEYVLLVLKDIKDEQGCSMAEDWQHRFKIVKPDYRSPAPQQWELSRPRAISKDTLFIALEEAMDYGSLSTGLVIYDATGKQKNGIIELSKHEKEVQFIPEENWKAGTHLLVIAPEIEDLAGNNLNRLFDNVIDTDSRQVKTISDFQLRFEVN